MTPPCIDLDDVELFMTSTGHIAFDYVSLDTNDPLHEVFSARGPLRPRSICDFLDDTLDLVASVPDDHDVSDLEGLLADLKLCVQKTEAALKALKD